MLKHKVGVKCATITPDEKRVEGILVPPLSLPWLSPLLPSLFLARIHVILHDI